VELDGGFQLGEVAKDTGEKADPEVHRASALGYILSAVAVASNR